MLFDEPSNFIFASILTGVYDVNRNEKLSENDFETVNNWYDSVVQLKLKGVIFHNTFSEKTVEKYQNKYVSFEKIAFDASFNPNVFRYLAYQSFIETNLGNIKNVFVTDVSDVVVLQNPFQQTLFLDNPDALFCGDEAEILDNEWMQNHSTHLRNSIPNFLAYEQQNKHKTLLNCGIIGGNVHTMKALMDSLANIHRTHTIHNKTPFTLDMGAFNYVARTQFSDKIIHGTPVNTLFKGYENERTDCWFRHK